MTAQSFDKIVKLATKPKNAPPKAKYIDSLIAATYADDRSINEIVIVLAQRLRDPNGVVVFKGLLTLHQMIRTGQTEALLDVLARNDVLRLRNIYSQQFQGYVPPASMGAYADYLDSRIRAYRELKRDLIRVQTESNRRSDGLGAASKARRLRHLPVEKGLLREVKMVQKMLDSLVKCKAGNEGVCNILEHYFEMSKVDATDSFEIYKSFIKQTDKVVDYLSIARKLHNVLNVPVPNLKHAPTGLVKALEEYLNDPNFEQNRIDYKKSLGVVEGGNRCPSNTEPTRKASPDKNTSTPTKAASPAPEVKPQAPAGASQKIQDFFESIQADQQPTMFGGAPQQINYAQMTVNQHQQFNPFRQSMMMPQQTGFMQPQMTGFSHTQQQGFLQPQQTGAMAFGRQSIMPMSTGQPGAGGEFGFVQPPYAQTQQPQMQMQMQPQQTGFLQPQATGFNPFRQSIMPTGNGMGADSLNGPMSQPSSPSPFAQLSHQTQGQAQIQRPGSTPAFSTPPSNVTATGPSSEPKPLKAQATGSKNPFAPAGGAVPPVPSLPSQHQPLQKKPTMNEMMMGLHTGNAGGAWSQPQAPQQQTQPMGQAQAGQQGNAQGTGMSSIASEFASNKNQTNGSAGANTSTGAGGTDFLSQFGSLSVNPTNASSPSTQTTASSSNPLSFLSTNPTGSTSATSGLTSQTTGANTNSSANGFLQPQPTGYHGSNVKPFKPSSSFGNQLIESLPPLPESGPGSNPSSSVASPSGAGAAGGVQPQSTGFPGLGSLSFQNTGNPAGSSAGTGSGLIPQMTGAPNPFRQSTMFGGSSFSGTGSLNPQITGMGAFSGLSAFGGQQNHGHGQGMFGQQQQQQQQTPFQQQAQQGSLI
ncbi:ENTH domain-containing protein [Cryptococcus deuterogattii 99/473]|uniref:Unplaced genomic scaffold supercont1.4, whole genome shotgun sequence n=1 Tax=Cryptococcus deuterogattii Ram5 TaxID=1296110 RepID=A0A0D0U1Q2_9TREE|nr:ENTH domain-containing protein [Cryptococcus deuterogattii Ram5]KIY55993.1 ENTH domain-containing protein [Cryptococcus deuterogattii 99/473]